MPAADDEADHQVGFGFGQNLFAGIGDGNLEALLDGDFQAVQQLVDALLQGVVFVDEGVADQHPGHARVFLREYQQYVDDAFDLHEAIGFFAGDFVDEAEQGLLDEVDQPFEHLRLAGEVPVERGFGDVEFCRQRGGGDFFALGRFQHLGQSFQNLLFAFACHGWFLVGFSQL